VATSWIAKETLKKLPALLRLGASKLKPLSGKDRDTIIEFVRLLDQRRAFYVPDAFEQPKAVLASIDDTKKAAQVAASKIKDSLAREMVEEAAVACRDFVDRWYDAHVHMGINREVTQFFQHLGIVRLRVQQMVNALGLYDPKAIEAPRIQAWRPETDGELDP